MWPRGRRRGVSPRPRRSPKVGLNRSPRTNSRRSMLPPGPFSVLRPWTSYQPKNCFSSNSAPWYFATTFLRSPLATEPLDSLSSFWKSSLMAALFGATMRPYLKTSWPATATLQKRVRQHRVRLARAHRGRVGLVKIFCERILLDRRRCACSQGGSIVLLQARVDCSLSRGCWRYRFGIFELLKLAFGGCRASRRAKFGRFSGRRAATHPAPWPRPRATIVAKFDG